MANTTTTDVLIIGAGPTGLALACQLIRYGVDFIVVDKNETTTPHSKAIGVQARTLEIYEQIGLADKLIDLGSKAERARMIVGGEVLGEIDFKNIGAGMSPYPFVLIVEQGKHEKLLHDHILSQGNEVRWQTELLSFTHDDDGVRAAVRDSNGVSEEVQAKFLVGCDGARSRVRHTLGLTFHGSTFERMFYVADVDIDWEHEHDALTAVLLRDNLLAFFPMAGEKQWRIVGTFPEEFSKDEGEVLYEEIEEQIKRDTQFDLDITKVNWFSTYKVHTRHVNKFSDGRCFLAGDSAHIHTPAGAQGMNTGIQDGYNLAWKLALVMRGACAASLLATYNEERLPNAENLLKTTDNFFNLAASPEPLTSFLRTHVFPYVANVAFSLDVVKKFVFPRVSQIAISYRKSSLSDHSGDNGFAVKAGDRMPYFEVGGTSVFERLHAPKFHLLHFSKDGETLRLTDSDLLRREMIPISQNVREIFGSDDTFEVLLRPDNHIAAISQGTSTKLDDYLARCL